VSCVLLQILLVPIALKTVQILALKEERALPALLVMERASIAVETMVVINAKPVLKAFMVKLARMPARPLAMNLEIVIVVSMV